MSAATTQNQLRFETYACRIDIQLTCRRNNYFLCAPMSQGMRSADRCDVKDKCGVCGGLEECADETTTTPEPVIEDTAGIYFYVSDVDLKQKHIIFV